MWLLFAILAPMLYGLVHVLDAYCVDDIFENPWMGMGTSAIATLIILLLLGPFVIPFMDLNILSLKFYILAYFSGLLVQCSFGFYFKSLSFSEAGIVAAYWNIIPSLVPIWSYLIFSEILHIQQYIGIAILIIASTLFYFIDVSIDVRKRVVLLMFTAAFLQSWTYIIDEYVYQNVNFFDAYFFVTLGLISGGLVPLLWNTKKYPTEILSVIRQPDYLKLFFFIELIDYAALLFAERAIDLGTAPLVSALEASIPAFTFVLLIIAPKKIYAEKESLKKGASLRTSLISLMILGTYLLAI